MSWYRVHLKPSSPVWKWTWTLMLINHCSTSFLKNAAGPQLFNQYKWEISFYPPKIRPYRFSTFSSDIWNVSIQWNSVGENGMVVLSGESEFSHFWALSWIYVRVSIYFAKSRDIWRNVWYWNTFLKSWMASFHSTINFGGVETVLMSLICIFMMDWDRMKESVCRTPLDFMFTEIITIWQKSKIVKKIND